VLLGLCLLFCAGAFHPSDLLAQQHDFWGDDGKAANTPGRHAFNSNCAGCHGLDGRGSDKGADIAASVNVRHLSDSRVSDIILNGIPGTGMPAFHNLNEREIHSIVGYVRILQGNLQARTLPGNAARGKEIFFGKGECSTCHAISGEGGFLGPDLSTYGSALPVKAIRDEILKPNRTEPTGYRSAVLTTSNGDRLEGIIRNEDNFSLQLLAKDGSFHFYQKSDLQAVERPGQSLMPTNYRDRLSMGELNDLVSYLMKAVPAPMGALSLSKTEEPTQ
jgi:cytochrome c oxidase cbb3-type subunit III